jgi:hypothetical protein
MDGELAGEVVESKILLYTLKQKEKKNKKRGKPLTYKIK